MPNSPDSLAVLMIRPFTGSPTDPLPPAFDCSRQYAAAKWDMAKWPLRCTRMTSSHWSSVMVKLIASRRIPALFTRMSSRP